MNGFEVFQHLQKDTQRKQRYSLKLGKKRRESSKRNYYILSPRVIINAIIITKPLCSDSSAPPSVPPSVCGVFVSLGLRRLVGTVRNFTFKIFLHDNFLFGAKNGFFSTKNPIRCDLLLFRLVGWLDVIWYNF